MHPPSEKANHSADLGDVVVRSADRKKKCDELWDEQRRCERCRVGKLDCYAVPISKQAGK